MISTYAIKVTPENINTIIADAAKWNLNVDYLQDTVDFNAEDGFGTFAILSVNYSVRQATFTEMVDADFEDNWIADGATHGIWNRVQLKSK